LATDASVGFDTAGVDLYLPKETAAQRATPEDLATYTMLLQGACADFFAQATTPEDLDIVVAVRSGQRSRVWFIASLGANATASPDAVRAKLETEGREPFPGSSAPALDGLRAKLDAIVPPEVTGGPIAFAIRGRIAGGATKTPIQPGAPPTPQEWKDVLDTIKTNQPLPFDDTLELVWPDNESSHSDAANIGKIVFGLGLVALFAFRIWLRRRGKRTTA
jgi:hypothetical protein